MLIVNNNYIYITIIIFNIFKIMNKRNLSNTNCYIIQELV